MDYRALATRTTPALIIYVLDMSESMQHSLGAEPKIAIVTKMLKRVIIEMIRRSTKGSVISPRYRIACFAYNDEVRDLYGGAITVKEMSERGIPVMKASSRTDTAKALLQAEALLQREWSNIQAGPAPLICHMTDGQYNGDDPLPIAERIMQMRTPDGNVLIENLFLDDAALPQNIDPYTWSGIANDTQLATDTARHLFHMSSPVPGSYQELFEDMGYHLGSGARLLFPGNAPAMIQAGFMMSGMTPTV
jgi:hypothetical protein